MPTALELGRKGWRPFLRAARRGEGAAEPRPADHARREKLLSQVREAAAELKARCGARRVVLFGSLASERPLAPDADVDLAIEGLGDGDYWEAWALVERIISGRSVDLVELETASESLRRAIRRYGIEM